MKWTLQPSPLRRASDSWEDVIVVHQEDENHFATLRIVGTVAQHQHSLLKFRTLAEALLYAENVIPVGEWSWLSQMTAERDSYRFNIASDGAYYVVTVLEVQGEDALTTHAHATSGINPFESWQDAVTWAEEWISEAALERCSCGEVGRNDP